MINSGGVGVGIGIGIGVLLRSIQDDTFRKINSGGVLLRWCRCWYWCRCSAPMVSVFFAPIRTIHSGGVGIGVLLHRK